MKSMTVNIIRLILLLISAGCVCIAVATKTLGALFITGVVLLLAASVLGFVARFLGKKEAKKEAQTEESGKEK